MTINNYKYRVFLLILLIASINISICIVIKAFNTPSTPNTNAPAKLALPTPSTIPTTKSPLDTKKTFALIIKTGDTITQLLQSHGINQQQTNQLLSNKSINNILSKLDVGRQLKLILTNHQLSKIQYSISNSQTISINRKKNDFTVETITTPLIQSAEYKAATIHSTLTEAGQRQHIPFPILLQLEHIFSGSVNFNNQIHPNDQIEVIYNEYYKNGQPYRSGKILLAALHLSKKTDAAIFFSFGKKHKGYYTLSGRGMEPLYLRVPLHYKRISSKFSYHRLDPITHKIQPHYGVDYAAPRGTPIHSIGDGIIVFKGRDHGYGNAIKIRYSKKYEALYAHMSRFAKVHNHEFVHKGQVIGYVGMTGWATGPHLHFGWYVNGIPRDPLKRKTIYNPPIPMALHHQFILHRNTLLNELQLFRG